MKTLENVIDDIYEVTNDDDVSPALALEALTAAIIGHTNMCDNPNRALLGVIAELGNLARFRDDLGAEYTDDHVPSLTDWIKEGWKEPLT